MRPVRFAFGCLEYSGKRRFRTQKKTRMYTFFLSSYRFHDSYLQKVDLGRRYERSENRLPGIAPQEWGRFLGRALREPKNSVRGLTYCLSIHGVEHIISNKKTGRTDLF